jgi:tape measure domain-containing protein
VSGDFPTQRAHSDRVQMQIDLAGAREAMAQAEAVRREMERLNAVQNVSGTEIQRSTGKGFLYNQMLFTIRRSIFYATLAVGAMTTGVVKMGIEFDANMQSNTLALSTFLGSTQAAHTELNFLYQLAAHTPFQFSDVTDAAKRFLAFGFTVQQANSALRAAGDASAAFGGSPEIIQRITLALGQMQAKGRVMGQELLQLEEAGVPASRILQQQLGLSADQMARIGNTGIPASVGIAALTRGMQQLYGGMASKQAHTAMGLFSTLQDNIRMLSGAAVQGIFNRIAGQWLPSLVKLTNQLPKAFQRGGADAAAAQLDRSMGAHGRVLSDWLTWEGILSDTVGILRSDVVPILIVLWHWFGVGMGAVRLFGGALSFLNHHSTTTRVLLYLILGVLVPLQAAYLAVTGAAWAWTTAIAVQEGLLLRLNTVMWAGLLVINTLAEGFTALTGVLFGLDTAVGLLSVLLEATPIGWIITGVVLLGVALYLLATHFHQVEDAVKSAFFWIKDHWYLLPAILVAPWVLLPGLIGTHLDDTKRVLLNLVHWIQHQFSYSNLFGSGLGWLSRLGGSGSALFPGLGPLSLAANTLRHAIPGAAEGGITRAAGPIMVGERGPEIVHLPPHSTITPLQHVIGPGMKLTVRHEQPVIVQLNRRTIGEAVARYQTDVEAAR